MEKFIEIVRPWIGFSFLFIVIEVLWAYFYAKGIIGVPEINMFKLLEYGVNVIMSFSLGAILFGLLTGVFKKARMGKLSLIIGLILWSTFLLLGRLLYISLFPETPIYLELNFQTIMIFGMTLISCIWFDMFRNYWSFKMSDSE